MKISLVITLSLQIFLCQAIDGLLNANHNFNAIHDSMRQFGNSLNHNGMSYFIARVPADTEFYHGTSSAKPIQGVQWLAFEPEHALAFARPARMNGKHSEVDYRGRGSSMIRRGYNSAAQADQTLEHRRETRLEQNGMDVGGNQASLIDEQPALKHEMRPLGYFHTYRTKRGLRLLYLDGQSAAKSTLGTLDTQDVVLRNKDDRNAPSPIVGDRERANDLCEMAKTEWNGQIDGFLRMVGGFEIILCSFERNLDVVHIKAVAQTGERGSGNNLDYQKAISARNRGIGGNRVSLEYESFLSMFALPGAVYFDRLGRPRVDNSSSNLPAVRSMISAMILDSSTDATATDWQAVTDMIVSRYAGRLELWTAGKLASHTSLRSGLQSALRPFIDDSDRNEDSEQQRCATQFLPSAANTTSLAAQAVKIVSQKLCSSLFSASAVSSYHEALAILQELKDYLQWTTWRECRSCDIDEVCKLPIWPVGDVSDFLQPRCTKNVSREDRGSYWDFSGRPRLGTQI